MNNLNQRDYIEIEFNKYKYLLANPKYITWLNSEQLLLNQANYIEIEFNKYYYLLSDPEYLRWLDSKPKEYKTYVYLQSKYWIDLKMTIKMIENIK